MTCPKYNSKRATVGFELTVLGLVLTILFFGLDRHSAAVTKADDIEEHEETRRMVKELHQTQEEPKETPQPQSDEPIVSAMDKQPEIEKPRGIEQGSEQPEQPTQEDGVRFVNEVKTKKGGYQWQNQNRSRIPIRPTLASRPYQ